MNELTKIKSAKFKITQVKSSIGYTKDQAATLHSLGLHRIGESVVRDNKAEFRGMANAVRHLVNVEEA